METLEARFHLFQTGQWHELLDASISNTAKVHQRSVRRRRQQHGNDMEKRAIKWASCRPHDKRSTEHRSLPDKS